MLDISHDSFTLFSFKGVCYEWQLDSQQNTQARAEMSAVPVCNEETVNQK